MDDRDERSPDGAGRPGEETPTAGPPVRLGAGGAEGRGARGSLSRRDLIAAAAAVGIASDAAGCVTFGAEGSMSYVVCQLALNAAVVELSFARGGRELAALAENGRLRVWSLERLREPTAFAPTEAFKLARWGPPGKLLTVTKRRKVRLYRVPDAGSPVWAPPFGDVRAAAWSADGASIALLVGDGLIHEVNATTGKVVQRADCRAFLRGEGVSAAALADVRQLVYVEGKTDAVAFVVGRALYAVELSQGRARRTAPPATDVAAVTLGAGGDRVIYVRSARDGLDVLTFPGLVPVHAEPGRAIGAVADQGAGVAYVSADGVSGLDLGAGGSLGRMPLGSFGATAVSLDAADPSTAMLAWGDKNGHVVVGRREGATLAETVVSDPKLATLKESAPDDVKLPYPDCTCTCNAVSVKQDQHDAVAQRWDDQRQQWMTEILPCGTPLPAGAVCLCNCVSIPAPTWTRLCTCNTVCTCNSQGGGGGYTLTYWY